MKLRNEAKKAVSRVRAIAPSAHSIGNQNMTIETANIILMCVAGVFVCLRYILNNKLVLWRLCNQNQKLCRVIAGKKNNLVGVTSTSHQVKGGQNDT